MSVYRKFDRNDILFSTIHARPRVSVKYGTNGWEGSTGPSASLSLYGGVRSRTNVKSSDFASSGLSIYPLDPLDTHSIDKVIYVSGSYPSTGSIRFVRCEDRPFASFLDVTDTRWYEEHFRPIELLYEYYGRFDSSYFLGNYDFYDVLLLANEGVTGSVAPYPGSYYVFSGTFTGSAELSSGSSWSAEAWIKPLPMGTSSAVFPFPHQPRFMGQSGSWYLSLTSQGQLQLTVEPTPSSPSTAVVNPGEWNHAMVVVSGGVSASYYLNVAFSNQVSVAALGSGSGASPLLVGAYVVSGSSPTRALNGFIFETRVWDRALTAAEVATNLSGTLHASASADLLHYARFNDGPFGVAHGFVSGSGAFDHGPNARHGYLFPYASSYTGHWQPNDHPAFVPDLARVNTNVADIRVVHVPSMFYGRQLDPGSVVLVDGVYNQKRVVRVFNDDGRGSLYVSGSMTRNISGEDYTGELRRKVGNVFYTEGLIVLTDPALYDVFDSGSIFWDPTVSVSGVFGDLFSANFQGQHRMHTKVFNCRLPTAQGNASNNPTFSFLDDRGTEATDDDRQVIERHDGVTYITAVGLYNEDRQLVAVAKLAQPIRKREKDKVNIRLKLDI